VHWESAAIIDDNTIPIIAYCLISGFFLPKLKLIIKGSSAALPNIYSIVSNFYRDQFGSIIMSIRSASTMNTPTNPTIRIVHVAVN